MLNQVRITETEIETNVKIEIEKQTNIKTEIERNKRKDRQTNIKTQTKPPCSQTLRSDASSCHHAQSG